MRGVRPAPLEKWGSFEPFVGLTTIYMNHLPMVRSAMPDKRMKYHLLRKRQQ